MAKATFKIDDPFDAYITEEILYDLEWDADEESIALNRGEMDEWGYIDMRNWSES